MFCQPTLPPSLFLWRALYDEASYYGCVRYHIPGRPLEQYSGPIFAMICGTPPGLHHKKVQPFGKIAQFSPPPPPPPKKKKPHTTGKTVTLVQSWVGPGVAGDVRFKKRPAKNARTFCKTFVHDCIILLVWGPTDILPRQVLLCTDSCMQHRLQTH